jgi:hypothetical protein
MILITGAVLAPSYHCLTRSGRMLIAKENERDSPTTINLRDGVMMLMRLGQAYNLWCKSRTRLHPAMLQGILVG